MKIKKTVIFLSLACAIFSSRALGNGIYLHQLYPAKNTRFMSVESPTISPAVEDLVYLGLGDDYARYYRDYYKRYYFDLNLDLVTAPLINVDRNTGERVSEVVENLGSMNLSAGYQWNPRTAVFAEVALHRVQLNDTLGFKDGTKFGLGDSRVIMKWLLNPPADSDRTWTFAVIPELTFPTGNADYFMGTGSMGYGVHLSAENERGKLIVSANLGFRYSSTASYLAVDYRKQFPFALGALYRWSDQMGWTAEMNGSVAYSSEEFQNHLEVYTGPRWRMDRDWTMLAGIGTGNFRSDMANDLRLIAQLKYTPFRTPDRERPVPLPSQPSKPDEFCELGYILFEVNSDSVQEQYHRLLDRFANRVMNQEAKPRIVGVQIQGHSSPDGSFIKNRNLAMARASAVKKELMNRGVSPDLIVNRGFGVGVAPKGEFSTPKEQKRAWRRAELFCEYR